MSCSKGSSFLALCAEAARGHRQEPQLKGLAFLSEDLLDRAAGFTRLPRQPSALEPGSLAHSQCQQHLALSAVSRAFGSTDPFLSYLLWPEGLQCCPLELLWAQCWPVTT